MQQPKKEKYVKSKYKPTKTKSLIDDEYYSDPELKNNFLKNYIDNEGKVDSKIDIVVDSDGRYTEKIGDREYKIYKGKDKTGEYYSFYDPKPIEKNTFSGNKELYDRIYINEIDKYKKNLQKEKNDVFKNYENFLKTEPKKITHTEKSTDNQLKKLKSFVKSPKYKEILEKQHSKEKATNIQNERLNNLNNLNYNIVNKIDPRGPGYINGIMFPTLGNEAIKYNSGEPKYDNNRLKYLSPEIKNTNDVYIEKYGYSNIPTHEFSHKMTNGDARLSNKDIKEIGIRTHNNKNRPVHFGMNKLSNTPMDYYRTPTEVQARLNSTRMLLKDNEIYDPNTQDFTKDHLEIIKKNINNDNFRNSDFQDLIKTVNSEDDFIWLMNNIVQKDNKPLTNVNIAAYGGNLKQQTNNNMLNEFNEGGTHAQNPLGGVPQGMGNNGMMNTVEEGETKKDSFIYSNRITLTPQVVAQFNLPKSLSGKTAADATKLINNKFEGRNSKIDNNTKKAFLDRIAEAQETVKAEEQAKIQEAMQINSTEVPDMMEGQVPQGMEEFTQPQQQMFNGGELSNGLSMLGASGAMGQHTGINQATTALDLGNTAFGKTGIDTSGATDTDPGSVKPGMMGVTGALKGAQAGAMFGPWGMGIGAAVGLGAGLIGGNRAKKDALKAHQNFEIGQSNNKISNFALGGNLLGEPNSGEPVLPVKKTPAPVVVSKDNLQNLNVQPLEDNPIPSTSRNKKMINLQSGVFNDKLGHGYYYYYDKKPGDPGFDVKQHRDFVTEKNHSLGQRTRLGDGSENPLYNYQLAEYLSANKKFAMGGNMYAGGGELKPWQLPSSKMTDDPSFNGGFGFKNMTGVPYATELPLDQQINIKSSYNPNSFYKQSFNQMGRPQISNDLGYISKLNYNDPDVTTLSPEQLQENNSAVTARTFGPQSNGHYEGEMYNGSKLENVLNKTGQYVKDNYGNALRYAPVAMNAYQLAKMGKPEVERLDRLGNRYNPQYMDERALTNQINAETNYTANALSNSSNGSLGSLSNNILGMQLNKTKALSDAYSKIADVNRNEDTKAQQFNLGVDQVNISQSNMEKDINARNRGAFKTERSKLLGQMGTDLGNIGKEEVYKKMAKEAFNYTWDGDYVVDNKGEKVIDPETNEPITKEKYEQITGKKTGKDYSKIFRTMNTNFGNLSLNNKNTKE